MKLYVESGAILGERSGIGQYVKRLVEAYHKQFPDQKVSLFGFKFITRKFEPSIKPDKILVYRIIRWLPGKIYMAALKYGFGIPVDILLGAKSTDIFLFPNFVRWPLAFNKRSVVFVYDLSFILFGQYTSPPNREYMMKFVPRSVRNSNHIVTISESSKRDIVDYFSLDQRDVSIVYPFIDTNVFKKVSAGKTRAVINKLRLPDKYFLFMSTIEPRKNVTGLLKAYRGLPKNIYEEYGLVLAGGKGWLNEDIHSEIDRMVQDGFNVVLTGYVHDDDLPALYSGATLYVFTPFYEGFGISPLEAMACGVPVITSNNSSLPEVVGDAGLLVDADKPEQTTKAIINLLSDAKKRQQMINKGYIQAQKFNPAKSAQQLQEVINKVSK